jgi:hypothetical protein
MNSSFHLDGSTAVAEAASCNALTARPEGLLHPFRAIPIVEPAFEDSQR